MTHGWQVWFSSSRKFYSPNKIYLLAPCWFLKLYQSVAKPFPAQVPLKKKKTYLKSSCNTIQKFKLNNLPGNHGSALQQVSHNQDTSLSLSEAGPPRNRHGSRDLYMQVYWRVFQWEGRWKEPRWQQIVVLSGEYDRQKLNSRADTIRASVHLQNQSQIGRQTAWAFIFWHQRSCVRACRAATLWTQWRPAEWTDLWIQLGEERVDQLRA